MFLFLDYTLGQQATVSHRLVFSSTPSAKSPFIFSNILPYPLHYAEVPTGYVHMSNGFMRQMKWDGIANQVLTVGVDPPTTAPTLSIGGSGTITGTYTSYARFIDRDGNPSNLSPISNSVTASLAGLVMYTNVPLNDDPKVERVQLLRNTSGQASVYYVDVDSTDLTGTTFTSAFTDSQLQVQEAVPLFDTFGNSIANRFAIPPNHKPFLLMYQGRLFAYGEIEYAEGHAECTFGSTTVTGVGTAWNSSMVERLFYVVGSPQSYQIESVDEAAQTLTLAVPFKEATDPFSIYCIRVAPALRRLIMFTEAGLFDAWPAVNGLELEENGDDGTGLASAESFLFILQKRHIYRMSYNEDPLSDGGVFLAVERGCINNRCWLKIDSSLYMLDEQGVYEFSAGGTAEPLSMGIQDMFWALTGDTTIRVNWKAQRFFHASLSQSESTMRWFVSLDGSAKPKDALCYNYMTKEWWTEKYPIELGSNCLMRPTLDKPTPLVCGARAKAFAFLGSLDQVSPAGTTRGYVTGATLLTIEDTAASFQSSGLVGASVTILDGTGKRQTRRIVSNTTTALTIDRPWLTALDTTSLYQIGGVNWLWRGVWSRWLDEDTSNVRRLVVLFNPRTGEKMNVRLYRDDLEEPETWGDARDSIAPESVSVRQDDPDLFVDLAQERGFAQIRMDGRRETYLNMRDFFALEMEGCAGENGVRLYAIVIDGSERK